jgi:hypothetical protein
MLSQQEVQKQVASRAEETFALLQVLIEKKVKQYVDMGLDSDRPLDEQSWWLFKAALYAVQLDNPHLFAPTTKADEREFKRLHQITPSVTY